MLDTPNTVETWSELTLGTPYNDYLETEGDVDWIKIVITETGTYEFSVSFTTWISSPTDSNVALALYDAEGVQIGSTFDSDEGLTETATHEFTETGTYFIAVSNTTGYAGAYSLTGSLSNTAPTFSGEDSLDGVTEGTDAVFDLSDLLANADDADEDTLFIVDNEIAVKDGKGTDIGKASWDSEDEEFTITLDDEDYNGVVKLTYTVSDGNDTVAGSATYEVTAENDAPTVEGPLTLGGVDEGDNGAFTVDDLLVGAEDVEGDTLSIYNNAISVEDAKGKSIGSASFKGDDITITLTDEDYNGTVVLKYAITDGEDTVAGSASYVVAAVNDGPPELTGEQAELDFGTMSTAYALSAADLLQGFTDPDGTTPAIIGAITSDHGTVASDGCGGYTFTPTTGYIGRVTFTFTVTDGEMTTVATQQTFILSDTSLLVTTYNPLSEGAVNTVVAGAQNASAVAHLTGGGYVVTWVGTDIAGVSTASIGIKAQRYNADGTTTGSEFQINTTGTYTQNQPTVTGLTGGGFIAVWTSNGQDGSSGGIYAQRYDSSGVKVGTETRINANTGSDQSQPTVTAFSDGGYMISWADSSVDSGDSDTYGVAARRYNADGTTNGAQILINTGAIVGDQQSPTITALADNGFVVTWHSNDEGTGLGYGIYARQYSSTGVAGSIVHVNTTTAGNQRFPVTTTLEDGGYVIAWQDSATTNVHFQRYDSSGSAQGSQTVANSGALDGTQTDPAIASLADGGFIVVWTSTTGTGYGDGSGSGIFAQRFNASGVAQGSVIAVNEVTAGEQVAASVTTLVNGSIVITWTTTDGTGNGTGIHQRIIEANTSPYLDDAQADLSSTNEDTAIVIQTADLLQGVSDDQGHTLDVTDITGDNFAAEKDGSAWTITPSENFNGTLTLNYTVSDGHGGTLNLTQTLVVTADNDAPIVEDGALDDVATEGGSSVTIDPLDNVSDVEHGSLSVTYDTLPAGVTYDCGSFTFNPTNAAYNYLAEGETADVVINYTVSDGTDSTPASITITITGTNDHPVITACGDTTGTVTEDVGPWEAAPITAITGGINSLPPAPTSDNLEVSGELEFTDLDLNDTHTIVSITPGNMIVGMIDYVGELTAEITTDSTDDDEDNSGVVTWTFNVANADVQFLGVGESLTQTYEILLGDGEGGTDTETVTITITGTNDAPTLSGEQTDLEDGTEDEDYTVTREQLLAGFTDADTSDTLDIEDLEASDGATVTANMDGSYTIQHVDNYNGPITLTYNVVDGNSGSVAGELSYDLEAVNDAPVGGDDSLNAATEETQLTYDVSDLISDVDLESIASLTITVDSEDGEVSVEGKIITFTPAANFYGNAIVTYTVSDGTLTDTGTLTFQVANTNDAPTAEDFSDSTNEETAVVIDVANYIDDVDPDETLTITAVSDDGSISISGTQITFTPNENFYGDATITYTVNDGETSTDGTITVSVANSDYDAPTVNPDGGTIPDKYEDTVIELTVEDFLSGIVNPDGATLTASEVFASQGVIEETFEGSGVYSYTPPEDYYGVVTINFTLNDGTNDVISFIKFNVINVNDAPVEPEEPDSVGSMYEDSSFVISDEDLLEGWTDVDFARDEGDLLPPLEITDVQLSTGTAVSNGCGGWSVTMPANFNGEVTVTYKVSDGEVEVTGTRTLTVTPQADGPVLDEDDAVELTGAEEDTPFQISEDDLLAGLEDPDGGTPTFTIDGLPTSDFGTFSGPVDGVYTFTPDADHNGEVEFSYTVSDGTSTSVITRSFTVAAVNDAPRGDPAEITGVMEDTPASFTREQLLANITDIDGGSLLGSIISTSIDPNLVVTAVSAEGGTFAWDEGTSKYVFTPTLNHTGAASITYSVSDGIDSEEFTSHFTVGAVNDAPAGEGAEITGATEDTPVTLTKAQLLANVTDVDNSDEEDFTIHCISATGGTFAKVGDDYVFTPTANYYGEASITYRVSDGEDSTEYTSTFTIASVLDEVSSSESSTLVAPNEKLILTGHDDIDGTGNSLNNMLIGNDGANKLDGKAGTDTMYGGANDDIYIVDNTGDVASEQTVEGVDDGGFDMVRSSATYTLGNFIEVLRLTGTDHINGTGNSKGNYLYGNSGNNVLDGSYGGDIMEGGAGNDTYYVNYATDSVIEQADGGTDKVFSTISYTLGEGLENLEFNNWGTSSLTGTGNSGANIITGSLGGNILYGLGGNDTLYGMEGSDVLDGGEGADYMVGGVSNDTYYVNHVNDVVYEDSISGSGIDTVITTIDYTLGANVERLTLGGTGNISGTGNSQNNIMTGNGGNNLLDGSTGSDNILAEGGNDTVIGGVGNDHLTGGAGLDRLIGGVGTDTLTGGTEADIFVFQKSGGGTDRVVDFEAGIDHLAFSASEFGFSSLTNAQFTSNSTGTAIGAGIGQFVYNTTTNTLVWDSNGSTGGGVTTIAIFDNAAVLTKADFIFE